MKNTQPSYKTNLSYLGQRLIRKISSKLSMKAYIDQDYSLDRIINHFLADSEQISVIDVGANIGQSIIRFSNLLDLHRIHAFEPQPEAVNLLKEKYHNDERVIINQTALGEEGGGI